MKNIFILLLSLLSLQGFAQTDTEKLRKSIDSAKALLQKANEFLGADTQSKSVRRDSTRKIEPPIFDTQKKIIVLPASAVDTTKKDSLLQDTVIKKLSVTLANPPIKYTSYPEDTAFINLLSIPFGRTASIASGTDKHEGIPHIAASKDYLFYIITGLLMFLAMIRLLFPKYFQNVFRLLFQASFRQKQTREQLMQEKLPSLMMNILFILVAGLFIALVAEYKIKLSISLWQLALYCITLLALVYIFKYLVIQFSGWVFNAGEQADTYSFIVFIINKAIALALLPLLPMLAFGDDATNKIIITIAACAAAILLILRYIISLATVRSNLKLNAFHFFIYLCAVEIMPVFIIYKALFSTVRNIHL